MERFQSTQSIEEYKRKSKTANATKVTTQWLQVFPQRVKRRDQPPPPPPPKQKTKKTEVLAPDTLVSILQYFFAEINKKDGNYYEASSLAAKFGCSTD